MNLPHDHTAMKLSRALTEAGFADMAEKAATGYYHDYLSPLAMPELQLLHDLQVKHDEGHLTAKVLIGRHMNGEFDASHQESEDWAASPEGQEMLKSIILGK